MYTYVFIKLRLISKGLTWACPRGTLEEGAAARPADAKLDASRIHSLRSNKKELYSHESLGFLSLSKLFSLDFLIKSLLFLLK